MKSIKNNKMPQSGSAAPARKGKQAATGGAGFPRAPYAQAPAGHVVKQDEFIANISGSVGFISNKYSINPGMSNTFPWLHRQAQLYDKYTVRKLEFYYTPMVSGFAAGGQTGKVMLMCDYDAADLAPTAKAELESSYLHADGMPYETVRMRIDPAEANDRAGRMGKYVRYGTTPVNTDIRLYDAGTLFLCTEGQASTAIIGELRVRYEIEFRIPQMNLTISPYGPSSRFASGVEPLITSVAENISLLVDWDGLQAIAGDFGGWIFPAGTYAIDFFADIFSTAATMSTSVMDGWNFDSATSMARSALSTTASQQQVTHRGKAIHVSDGKNEVGMKLFATGAATLSSPSAHMIVQKFM